MGIMQRWKGRVYGAVGQFLDLQAGIGAAAASLFGVTGVASLNVTAVANTATNTLVTLMSYSLPANALDKNGRSLFIKAWGRFAGNAAPKSVQLKFGGASFASGTSTQSGGVWQLEGRVIRSAASVQSILFAGSLGTTGIAPSVTSDTSVDTAAITISAAAKDDSATQSDVIQDGLLVQYSR